MEKPISTRSLECCDGAGNKFWEVHLDGDQIRTRWGRTGTTGQSKTKSYANAVAARKDFDKQIAAKLAKGYAAASQGTARPATDKTAAEKTPPPPSGARSRSKGADAATRRQFVKRVLHVEGAPATELSKLWRSAEGTDVVIDQTIALLGSAVVAEKLPEWLKLDDDEVLGTVVHVAEPAFMATPDDEDELWGRAREEPMVILTSRGKVRRTDGQGSDVEEKLDAGNVAEVTAVEFMYSSPISRIAWRDSAPDQPGTFKKWVKALAEAARGELDAYEVAEYAPTAAKGAVIQSDGSSAHGHGGVHRTNATVSAGPVSTPRKLWVGKDQHGGGGEHGGDPVVCDDVVYGTHSYFVEAAAFNRKGKLLWSTPLSKVRNWSTGATCVCGGVAYFPTKDGVHAVIVSSGNRHWLARCKGQASSPLVVEGLVLFGGRGEFIAVAPDTGRKKWKHAIGAEEDVGAPAYRNGIVYSIAVDNKSHASRIVALEVASGKVVFDLPCPWLHNPPSPMVVGDQILCTVDTGAFGALHPETGKVLWSKKIDVQQVAATEQILVVRNAKGLAAYDVHKKAKRLWADALEGNYPIGRAGPFIAGDVIYSVRTIDVDDAVETFLQAVRLDTGEELWRLQGAELGLNPFSWYCTPCVVDGVLYAQTDRLVALG